MFHNLDEHHFHQRKRELLTNIGNTECKRLDRATMKHSVEARVPFLDQSIVDWSLAQPKDAFIQQSSPTQALLPIRRHINLRHCTQVMVPTGTCSVMRLEGLIGRMHGCRVSYCKTRRTSTNCRKDFCCSRSATRASHMLCRQNVLCSWCTSAFFCNTVHCRVIDENGAAAD